MSWAISSLPAERLRAFGVGTAAWLFFRSAMNLVLFEPARTLYHPLTLFNTALAVLFGVGALRLPAAASSGKSPFSNEPIAVVQLVVALSFLLFAYSLTFNTAQFVGHDLQIRIDAVSTTASRLLGATVMPGRSVVVLLVCVWPSRLNCIAQDWPCGACSRRRR